MFNPVSRTPRRCDVDGTAALCEIKAARGMTIAKKLDMPTPPDTPRSAIASGCIDFVLSPEEVTGKIIEVAPTAAPQLTQSTRAAVELQNDENKYPYS